MRLHPRLFLVLKRSQRRADIVAQFIKLFLDDLCLGICGLHGLPCGFKCSILQPQNIHLRNSSLSSFTGDFCATFDGGHVRFEIV